MCLAIYLLPSTTYTLLYHTHTHTAHSAASCIQKKSAQNVNSCNAFAIFPHTTASVACTSHPLSDPSKVEVCHPFDHHFRHWLGESRHDPRLLLHS